MPDPARPLGTDDADDLRLYLEAAAREPLLTKEEEVELAMTIEGGKEAEDRLRAFVEERDALKCVHADHGVSRDLDDLCQNIVRYPIRHACRVIPYNQGVVSL